MTKLLLGLSSKKIAGVSLVSAVVFFWTNTYGLDLTPTQVTRKVDGASVTLICLNDNDKRVEIPTPPSWRVMPVSNVCLKFLPDQKVFDQAEVQLRLLRSKPGDPPFPATPEEIREWSRQFVPAGAKNAEVLGEADNTLSFEGRASREITFGYSFYGKHETMAVIIVDRTSMERVIVLVTDDAKRFNEFRQQAGDLLGHWILRPKQGADSGAF